MPLKEIKIEEKDGEIVVDLWPGMFTTPSHVREPTEKNPNIKADLGPVGGKLSPLKIYYPKDEYDIDDILDAADSIQRKDSLFSKTDHCPMCERKKREIIARIRSALRRGGSDEERRKNMMAETARIREELQKEGYITKWEKEAPASSAPVVSTEAPHPEYVMPTFQPTVPVVPEFLVEQRGGGDDDGEWEGEEMDMKDNSPHVPDQEEIIGRLNGALSEVYKTALMIVNTPSQIRIPFAR